MHSPTDSEIIQATENRRIHVYTWRTNQAMRKRLEALRHHGSINQIITTAVEALLKEMEQAK